jgi:hypothetical protein
MLLRASFAVIAEYEGQTRAAIVTFSMPRAGWAPARAPTSTTRHPARRISASGRWTQSGEPTGQGEVASPVRGDRCGSYQR